MWMLPVAFAIKKIYTTMKHKLRNSESNISPMLVEYTQGGILIRFDIRPVQREETTMYEYQEFWFDKNTTDIEKVVNTQGFELTEEYKKLL